MNNRLLGFVALALVASVSTSVQASVYTELGDWSKAALGGAGTVNITSATALGGASYTNSYGGLPLSAGTTFTSVGAVPIGSLQTPTGGTGPSPTGVAGVSAVVNFALEGHVVSVNTTTGQITVQFDRGGAAIFTAPSAGFNTSQPSTWGSLTGGGAFVSPVLAAVLKPQEDIHQGNVDARGINQVASSVNVVSGTLAPTSQLTGLALTREVSDPNNLITPTTFDPFTLPFTYDQSIVFDQIAERIGTPTTGSLSIGAAQVTQLNTIFAGIFGSLSLTPTNVFNFATGFNGVGGGPASDYSPFQALLSGADFPANLDTTVTVPSIQVVPEPASIFVWAVFVGAVFCGAAYGVRKGKRVDA